MMISVIIIQSFVLDTCYGDGSVRCSNYGDGSVRCSNYGDKDVLIS